MPRAPNLALLAHPPSFAQLGAASPVFRCPPEPRARVLTFLSRVRAIRPRLSTDVSLGAQPLVRTRLVAFSFSPWPSSQAKHLEKRHIPRVCRVALKRTRQDTKTQRWRARLNAIRLLTRVGRERLREQCPSHWRARQCSTCVQSQRTTASLAHVYPSRACISLGS